MSDPNIAEIRDLAIAASETIGQDTDGNAIALPGNFVVHDLEPFKMLRRRFRGQLRTNSLADFVLYTKARRDSDMQPPSAGFIDAERLSATVVFNFGTADEPGHCDDLAILQMKSSPAYAALLSAHANALQHLDALNWLQDQADHITYANEDGEAMLTHPAYNALRKVTISQLNESTSEERTHGTSRSAMETVDARGSAQLPALIRFTCTPYEGLPDRTLWVRLNIRERDGKPIFHLRIRNLDAEREDIAQDFKAALLRELEGRANLVIGTFTP